MSRRLLVLAPFLLAGLAVTQLCGEDKRESVERGRYLATQVAMCVQCHSPRNERGNLIHSRLFHGARIPVASPWPKSEWVFVAPRLIGLPATLGRERLVTLLMTGSRPDGRSPQPPMPPFRLTHDDAMAIVDYLASLP